MLGLVPKSKNLGWLPKVSLKEGLIETIKFEKSIKNFYNKNITKYSENYKKWLVATTQTKDLKFFMKLEI